MFSGIIEEKATVLSVEKSKHGKIVVRSELDHSETQLGDSIAINGVCLTVTKKQGQELTFDLSTETFQRTTFSNLSANSKVNLERSLQLGARIHGHLVYGHVDGVVELAGRYNDGHSEVLEWQLPQKFQNFIVEKGSVALAGVSLTVAKVTAYSFTVAVIPHTLALTTLSDLRIGEKVNLEVDMLARYIQKQKGDITEDFLRENGYCN